MTNTLYAHVYIRSRRRDSRKLRGTVVAFKRRHSGNVSCMDAFYELLPIS